MALIAAQMYTLRDFCKTPVDIAKSCAKVKKMGYDGIQISGMGKIEAAEMKKILDGEGLQCAATHVSLDEMEKETARVIEEHQLWNCKYTAIGGFFTETWNRSVIDNFIVKYNAIAKKFAGSGVSIGYHNHHHEFAPVDGQRPMDLLINNLDPEIWIEIDTHWVARGGSDPAAYIEKVAGRIPCVHFKDMTISFPERLPKMCEIGDGNLHWHRIVQACRYAGVRWYIVERDSGDLDPFDSLERSLFNMREKMGL
ncbi:MAG: sugar phosphate isomerase/epimerase [Lentisphaerae bacterium]|nr:sugar phosphate isomerase/epimerase [Lentisphaerota bacterium]